MTYQTILVERADRVGIITLNRPKALNALNGQVMDEVTAAAKELDDDPGIGAIIVTGNEKAFAAGADIKEMAGLSFADVFGSDFFAKWNEFAATRTPTVAAVAGYALGGGCELAMMCDVLIAADNAKFGQPEIKLGVLPGMGGSQRLTGVPGGARRGPDDGGQGSRRHHLADVAVGGADGQGGGQPGVRIHADRGPALRTPTVPLGVRHRGPEGRHGRLHRQTGSGVQAPIRCMRD